MQTLNYSRVSVSTGPSNIAKILYPDFSYGRIVISTYFFNNSFVFHNGCDYFTSYSKFRATVLFSTVVGFLSIFSNYYRCAALLERILKTDGFDNAT